MKDTAERSRNPFHPQFGKRPDKFIGRDSLIRDFLESLSDKNDPKRTMVISGIRGSGKTALLSGVKEAIDPKHYAVVDVTAGVHLLQSIVDQMYLLVDAPDRKLTGISLGALGFSVGLDAEPQDTIHGFRYNLTLLVQGFQKHGKGVVFLIDEAHNDSHEMREFATTYQHLVRDGFDVALLMAGLPQSVYRVLNDKVLTFLHRAQKTFLTKVNLQLVENMYHSTFNEAGFVFEDKVIEKAAEASCGFPYLIQLIGYYLWNAGLATLSKTEVDQALLNAKIELFQNVHQLILQELSLKDREFLVAMLNDKGDSRFSDLAKRLDVTSAYASKYRQRLIESGVIIPTAYGQVKVEPPYFKEFLAQYVV